METAQRWGIETAARYNRLVFSALEAIRVTSCWLTASGGVLAQGATEG
jgi:hypothetical protein